ncbi:DUF6790 family protein [Desulfovibrio inopinatus]|uniref:DUF6790 family protein n=1 Tax=Desulfovibrio inopinatus TaxID=102109 RepID=UPI0003F8D848|nr:DUF6790 family protein [Desulfovibrio inopinatus]
MIEESIRFVLANDTLVLFLCWLAITLIRLLMRFRQLDTALAVDIALSWFLFLNIGISFLYNFVIHAFYGDMVAHFIGWAPSPFQFEVATASLGFGLVGVLAFKASLSFRCAAILGPSCFLLGAAAGHIKDMIVHHNFAPGNAGAVFYTDIVIPVVGLALLFLAARFDMPRSR